MAAERDFTPFWKRNQLSVETYSTSIYIACNESPFYMGRNLGICPPLLSPDGERGSRYLVGIGIYLAING